MAKKIFLIAGESSGDDLGAKLIRALRAQSAEPVELIGIGGARMEAEGFKSLIPMEELNVMGIWEVAAHLPRLLRLLQGVVEEIEKEKPDAVVTIDLPDFNFQVASRIKKRGITNAKLIHYVAPSVWAWRPKRADKIAAFLDALLCLYPFEPSHFPKLKAEFVGHPLIELHPEQGNDAVFRQERSIPEEAKTLGLFFGSRLSELKSTGGILIESARMIREYYQDLHVIIPTLPHMEYEVLKLVEKLDFPAFVITSHKRKWDAFRACDAAIAVSGTVGLELAYAGIPHVITYKTNPVTWLILKTLVKVKHAHLANILLGEDVIPEFLQSQAQPINIGKALLRLYKVEEDRARQIQKSEELRALLGSESKPPSTRAADVILSLIG